MIHTGFIFGTLIAILVLGIVFSLIMAFRASGSAVGVCPSKLDASGDSTLDLNVMNLSPTFYYLGANGDCLSAASGTKIPWTVTNKSDNTWYVSAYIGNSAQGCSNLTQLVAVPSGKFFSAAKPPPGTKPAYFYKEMRIAISNDTDSYSHSVPDGVTEVDILLTGDADSSICVYKK